jgi:hypothetical protein
MDEPEPPEEIQPQNADQQVDVPPFGGNPVDTLPIVAQPPSGQMFDSSRFEDRRSSYPYLLPFDTKTLLNKLLGLLYFFLGGITVFLSFYLPDTLLRDTALRYVIPIILGIVSIILIIHGYFRLTEDDRDHKW